MAEPKPLDPKLSDPSPAATVLQLMTGYWVSQAIYAAAKLGLADLVQDGPKSSNELVQAAHAHAPSVARLLRALASVGVFVEQADGRFATTPLAACLQTDGPGSLHAAVLMFGEDMF